MSSDPGPRIADRVGWIVLGLLILGLVIGGVAIISGPFPDGNRPVAGTATGPTVVGGGDSVPSSDDTIISISGVDNTVSITGQCARVVVSGVKNMVTLERTGAIDISGMNNRIVFRSGTPEINQSGIDNTVERG